MRLLSKLRAFLKRDLELALTYRLTFVMDIGQTLALLASFFFIGKLFKGAAPLPSLAPYGGDYFQFVFLGVAFGLFMSASFNTLGETVDFERSHGTLEAILMTPTSFTALALSKVFWDLMVATLKVMFYLILGQILFGRNLVHAQWSGVVIAVVLMITTFLGLGMLSAGLTLILRDGNPLDRIVGWASRFLGGVYFPIAVFPHAVRNIASWLPLTCTLETVRQSLLSGASLTQMAWNLKILLGYSIIFLPAGFFFFRWAFAHAQREGSLSFD